MQGAGSILRGLLPYMASLGPSSFPPIPTCIAACLPMQGLRERWCSHHNLGVCAARRVPKGELLAIIRPQLGFSAPSAWPFAAACAIIVVTTRSLPSRDATARHSRFIVLHGPPSATPQVLAQLLPHCTGGHACRQDSQAFWPGHQRYQPSRHQLSRGLWRPGQPGEAAGGVGSRLFVQGRCALPGAESNAGQHRWSCATTCFCVYQPHSLHLTPLPSPPPCSHSATG